jgi:VanZ family protein
LAPATRGPKRLCWQMRVFLVLYGIATESLQLLVPHRTARVMDGFENILGIVAGSGFYIIFLWSMQPFLNVNLAAGLVKRAVEEDAAGKR